MASLSSLASADVTLSDGTELFVGSFTLVAPDKQAVPDSEDQEFAALAEEYADVFKLPNGLPPSSSREYELVIDTGDALMPRSRPLKRFSQGEQEAGGVPPGNGVDSTIARFSRSIGGLRAQVRWLMALLLEVQPSVCLPPVSDRQG